MELTGAHLIFFSPTHTSRQVGEAILKGLGLKQTLVTDLTCGGADFSTSTADTLTVVAVPVYGGHIPQLAISRMASLKGEGAPVVPVVVYGNRAFDKALQELGAFLEGKGFKVVAGGAFVGEHSYSTLQYPIAAGRPNRKDLEEATAFGRQVADKVKAAKDGSSLRRVEVKRIRRPKQPLGPLLRFVWRFLRLSKSGTPMPTVPVVDASLCNHCGHCAATCPNQAIVKGDECHTQADRCIRCCACVKGCPQKARSFDTPFSALLSDSFKQQKENEVIVD